MTRLLRALLLALLLAPLSSATDLAYAFHLLKGPERVRIDLTCAGSPSGETAFRIQEKWASVSDTAGHVTEVKAHGVDGAPFEVKAVDPHSWNVLHPPSAMIVLEWQLVPSPAVVESDSSSYYRPLSGNGFLHLIGETGLLWPTSQDERTSALIGLSWNGFAEAGWNVISSFGAEQDGLEVRTTLREFLHALFLAGPLRLYEELIEGAEVRFALFGDDLRFDDEEFVDLATRIVRAEREFFDDHEPPYFLISLLPVGGPDDRGSMGGTGLTASFALFLTRELDLDPKGPHLRRMIVLLAHELFHYWNGSRIGREPPEPLTYWFSEGFTDYFCRLLMLREGLLSEAEYLDELNQLLQRFYLSPARESPNARIAEEFWSSREVGKLPYERGHLVALLIDREIRRVSSGQRSLDDLIREILRRADEEGYRVGTRSFLELLEGETSAEFAARMSGVIVDGRLPELPRDLAAPAVLEWTEQPVHQLGFDLSASEPDRIVRGVIPDSAAHAAGLRDGQAIVGWSIHHGRTDLPVKLQVDDGGERREISYIPVSGQQVAVPRLRLD